ncbi:MAG: PDZ domain-containing protein [Candidatus Brocadiia bacterium]
MHRILPALFVVLCLAVTAVSSGEDKPASALILSACSKTVVGISCVREAGGEQASGFGLGTFIDWDGKTGTFLLVHNQLYSDGVDNPRYSVYLPGGVKVARLETFDSARKMSILRLAEPVADAVSVKLAATPSVQAGDELYLVYCLPQAFNYAPAIRILVASSVGSGKKGQEIITDADVASSAFSGSTSGLVYKADGSLVGMLVSLTVVNDVVTYVCSHDFLSSAISDMASKKTEVKQELKPSEKPCWFGALTSPFGKSVKSVIKGEKPSVDYGAVVSAVLLDSPAEKSKFRVMDVITEVNGIRAIGDNSDLELIFASLLEGSDISVSFYRFNAQAEDVGWELKTKTLKGERRPQILSETERYSDPFLKAEVAPFSWDLKIRSYILDRFTGVYITKIEDGVLKTFGFQEGALIVKVNNVNTPDIQSFKTAVGSLSTMSGKTVEFLVCLPDGYNRPLYKKILIP